jgi:hypothetical protein
MVNEANRTAIREFISLLPISLLCFGKALDHKGATQRAGTPACVAHHKASKDHMPHGYHSSYHT